VVEFREISETEWEGMPEPKPAKPPNPWDELLGAVDTGKIVVIDIPQEKLRGARIGIARSGLHARVQAGVTLSGWATCHSSQ
jgi:hypothetical protein